MGFFCKYTHVWVNIHLTLFPARMDHFRRSKNTFQGNFYPRNRISRSKILGSYVEKKLQAVGTFVYSPIEKSASFSENCRNFFWSMFFRPKSNIITDRIKKLQKIIDKIEKWWKMALFLHKNSLFHANFEGFTPRKYLHWIRHGRKR